MFGLILVNKKLQLRNNKQKSDEYYENNFASNDE